MQYDVKTYHASASGNAVTYAVRLKGVTVMSGTVSARNMAVTDPALKLTGTYSQSSTTITVTSAAHGLVDGQRVFLNIMTEPEPLLIAEPSYMGTKWRRNLNPEDYVSAGPVAKLVRNKEKQALLAAYSDLPGPNKVKFDYWALVRLVARRIL